MKNSLIIPLYSFIAKISTHLIIFQQITLFPEL